MITLVRQIVWFAWPAWLLALWTLWRWRRRLASRHIVVPLAVATTLLAVWVAMAGSDRALMLALPALAVLAAFALPTLQRSAAAAIDWFSVFFFTIAVATGWVFYVAMQTGMPAKLAANVAKLSPGYANTFSALALALALAGTLAWLWLVRWRTGRHRHPLWKSLVLPAGGVSVCWLLVMTLLLPPLDNARSYRSMMQRIAQQVPAGACIAAPGMARAQVVALEYLGGYRVDATARRATDTRCEFLMLTQDPEAAGRAVAIHRPRTPPAQRRRRHRHLPSRRRRLTPAGAVTASSIASRRRRLRREGSPTAARTRNGREDEPEGRALARLAVDVELAAVTLHDVLDDRQPEPGAAGLARAAAVDAIEALGQPRQMDARDPWAAVDDGDLAAAVVGAVPARRRCGRRRACSEPRC